MTDAARHDHGEPGAGAPAADKVVPVLIVNDNPAQRLALQSVLAPLGYTIVEADSGLAALRCVRSRDFAVILLDVRMPDMDGFETAALLRQRLQTEMTPIIFITAYGAEDIPSTDLYSQGAVDFMFAPVPPAELRAKVSVFANLFLDAEQRASQAREVQASVDQLRLLTDAAPIGIFQTDADDRYVYTNPRWTEIVGIPPAEALGTRWGTLVGAGTRAGLISDLTDSDAHPGELSHRFEIQVPGSATRIVLVTSKSIPGRDGGTIGWVGTVADITAEAGAEAAMSDARDKADEASRLKSDFLANMSHEIRTPMNGVIGMTDLLLETDLDPRQRDYAQTVRNSGEALLTIINDILDFSKVEAGRIEIEDIDFDVQVIVDDVADLLAGPALTKGLEVVAIVDRLVPAVVRGDPGRVRQVLTNLIGNAIKFTQAGEIVVRVTGSDVGDDTSVLRFEVADTGDGIAPDKVALVFQPFVQADSSTSRRYGGTGLGLAISRDLVSLMDGECGVTSRLGEGSTFWFTIEVHADRRQESHDLRTPDPALTGLTALIVEENPTQRRALTEYLTGWGMAVTTAADPAAAVVAIRNAATSPQPFAIAVLDRAPEPATDLGTFVVLTKPVRMKSLRSSLRIALGLEVEEVPAADPPLPLVSTDAQGGRLLLAEDNAINQKVAVAMLASAGFTVHTVANGAAAVQANATQSYDAILMDCQMPEMNGYEATKAIRAEEGSSRHTPIIAMTAGARSEDRERCRLAGMDAYLSKPVSKDALLALVSRSITSGKALTSAMSRTYPSAEEITIDPVIFDKLRVLGAAAGQDFLADLVDQFVADTGPLLVQLRDAIALGDTRAVGRIAHMMKGSSGQLGGRRLAASCSRMEHNAATGSLTEGESNLRDIEADYETLRRAWTEQLSSDPERSRSHA